MAERDPPLPDLGRGWLDIVGDVSADRPRFSEMTEAVTRR
jgi:hypothetical protein